MTSVLDLWRSKVVTPPCSVLSASAAVPADRTTPQHAVDAVRLADLWRARLEAKGWSPAARGQFTLCLAKSTLDNYNRYINLFRDFCAERGVDFPQSDSAIVADFLVTQCGRSDRPHSTLRCISAALAAMYEACEAMSPIQDSLIARLSQAIVKSGTRRPIARSSVMDISAFVRLFESWPGNDSLSVKLLRLKTITLLAIALMLRPSDIAPLAMGFHAGSGVMERFVLTMDQIQFRSDGRLDVTFLGIKNDAQRTGFRVTLPPNPVESVDPVAALRVYLARTESCRCPASKPVFLTLVRPFQAVSASTVASILQDAIHLAEKFGLAKGHTPKDFRPTGATRAVELGFDADDVQRLGRWKTRSVFLDHYVHNSIAPSFTQRMFE
ncbi:uncharacterized protein LOC122394089 isoform X1 [Amphibalanus amphitrite]|uniref:uncharacterized protein LOC122394089 isoform X1 n=1 Tax=Amphibalanus amphitrite TaxID=1232801 RepID=UPI001C9205D1|nr:uncharacterized protein LOC122394089 isoform X1 [Amphibalanus amphitrite]